MSIHPGSSHPAVHEKWNTTFRVSYPKPTTQDKPTATKQAPVSENEFDNTQREGYRKSTKAGGYQANAQLWDETSWATEKNLHTDQLRTEYRNRFN